LFKKFSKNEPNFLSFFLDLKPLQIIIKTYPLPIPTQVCVRISLIEGLPSRSFITASFYANRDFELQVLKCTLKRSKLSVTNLVAVWSTRSVERFARLRSYLRAFLCCQPIVSKFSLWGQCETLRGNIVSRHPITIRCMLGVGPIYVSILFV
jgi:hypothetical protein